MKPEDIRDIRAPLPFPPWWHWPLALAVAAVVALGVVLLVRAWRRRRLAPLSPLELAELALELAEEHARAGRSREWAAVVSDTVRGALAARLGAAVLPQTTTELEGAVWASVPSNGASPDAADSAAPEVPDVPLVLGLLKTCDLARFALATFTVDALVANTAAARELVLPLLAPRTEAKPVASTEAALVTS